MILSLLRNHSRFVTVDQLSGQLFVSGAILLESISAEAPMVLRKTRNEMQKHIIASIARPYIKDGMTIFMDSSSTVFALARNLSDISNLRIITNNLKIIWLLAERKGFTIMCAGGNLDALTMSFLESAR